MRRWLAIAAAVVMVALAGTAVAWRLGGGRVERVETPSMGTVAPVGSLLWVRPLGSGALRAGDFITFHPPDRPDLTYSHRVRQVYGDGSMRTGGEISGADPWRLRRADVVGRVVMTWPGAGWLVRMAPVLLLGGLVVWVATRRSSARWRGIVAMVGVSVVLALAVVVYRPLVAAQQVSFRPTADGARATYVGTGLLPIRVSAAGGGSVVLRDGQVGSVTVPAHDPEGHYAVELSPAVPWQLWLAMVLACFVPAVTATLGQLTRRRPRRHRDPEGRLLGC